MHSDESACRKSGRLGLQQVYGNTQFFMKILNLAFIYKKPDTLRYVEFLYSKIQTLRKKQDNLRYVLYTKIRIVCSTRFFVEFLKLAEWRGHFYMKKTMHFALHFYAENKTLRVTFYIQKPQHFVLHFYVPKNALCITFLYLNSIV